ncbi:M23 family metallopeptidase [Nocardia aurantia]|uniref:M23 family metallopeptidase n=1 Tax=Nocardia aurantia TaxID=2585199 RepID=UPI0029E81517|nr:M23 family metallopeptidase [Nocardia aurantia]
MIIRPDWRSRPRPPTLRQRMRALVNRLRPVAPGPAAGVAAAAGTAEADRTAAPDDVEPTGPPTTSNTATTGRASAAGSTATVSRQARAALRRIATVGRVARMSVAGAVRSGAIRVRHTARTRDWRRTSQDARKFVETHRVLLIVLCGTAILATSDARPPHTVDIDLELGATQRVPIAYGVENQAAPESARRYLDAIDNGERIRESQVVAAASRATLERAKAEAAAAAAGRPAPWLPGPATLPGIAPSLGGYALPARGVFTSGYGNRWGTFHYGIDIAAPIGSPIYAVADGTVIDAGPAQGFGLWVRIRHDDGTITVYGHMYDFSVSVGERVHAGEQIARVGNRGDSTGPHLHFEVLINGQHIDPQPWLALHGITIG